MNELFSQIEPWHWMTFGFVLLILEMLAPATLFLWMGVSAIVVSVIAWLFPALSWHVLFVLFGSLSIATFFGWREIAKRKGYDKEDVPNTLNQRSKSLIGRRGVLNEAVKNGIGRIQLDDTFWRIEGDDMPKGTKVQVIEVDGATLKVKAVE